MYIILLGFIVIFYLIISYINFSKLKFLENYQLLLNIDKALEQLCYHSLFLVVLGGVLFLVVFKVSSHIRTVEPKHQFSSKLIKPMYFCILAGTAASCLALFYSLFYLSGFASYLQRPDPWSKEELYQIAVHEAGHILIREIEFPNSTVKAQIIPTKDIIKSKSWFEQSLPAGFVSGTRVSRINTFLQIEKSIRIYLAGLAAEELIFGKNQVSTSSVDDLNKVQELVIKLCNSGLSPLGPVTWDVMSDEERFNLYNSIVNEQYKTVMNILKNNKDVLLKLADELAAKGTLTRQQIRDIVN